MSFFKRIQKSEKRFSAFYNNSKYEQTKNGGTSENLTSRGGKIDSKPVDKYNFNWTTRGFRGYHQL